MIAIGLAGIAWLSVFGHRGVAPCAAFMALGVALRPAIWREGFALLAPVRVLSQPLSIAAVSILCFCLWIAASGAWSPTPGAAWLALTVLAAVLCSGALAFEATNAAPRRARRLGAWLALAISVACAALLFEGLSGGYLRAVTPPLDPSPGRYKDMTALARGVTAIAPLVFPAAVIIRRLTGSMVAAVAPCAMLLVAAAHLSVFSNVVALVAGALCFALALVRPKSTIAMLAGAFVVAMLAAPFIATMVLPDLLAADSIPASWAQRLIAWRETGLRALGECLPLGCGADYARDWFERASLVDIPNWPIPVSEMPTHPHNLFLQLWLELGVIGVASFSMALVAGAATILRMRTSQSTCAAIAGVAAVCLISVMFEASLWQAWRLAIFSVAAFAIALANAVENIKG